MSEANNGGWDRPSYNAGRTDAKSALCPGDRVGPGGAYVVVPVEPTPEMLEGAGTIRHWEGTGFDHEADAAHIEWWRAMLSTLKGEE